MTMPPVDANGIRDFTIKRNPIQFRIDDDVFSAPPIMSPTTLKRIAALHASLGDVTPDNISGILDKIGEMFTLLLPGESGQRFVARMRDEERPLDIEGQLIPIIYWFLEQYGLRPTVPSSLSETGSTESGTATQSDGDSLTDGASQAETETISTLS